MIYITIGLLAIIPTLLEMWLGGSMYQTPQHILSNITLAFAGGFMLRHIIKIHEQSGGFFNEIFSAHYTLLSFNQIIFLVTSVGYPLIFLNMNNSSFDFLSTWFNLAFMIIMIYFITMPSFYLTYFLLSPKCTGLRFRNVFPWRPLSLGFIHLLCWSMFVFFKPDISLESTFYIIFIALVVVSGFWFIHSAKKTHMKANKRLRLCLIMVIICLVGYLGSVYLKYGTGVGVISFKYMPWIYFGMGFLLLLAIWTFVVILIYCQKERE
jgi:hypothetical protein